jgi:SAM-dependent methyltransferase
MTDINSAALSIWENEAKQWSLGRKDPLVGWYNAHLDDPNEELILFRDVPLKKGLLALEFGCGPGRNMIKFRDHFNRIDGVDISPTILEKLPLNLQESDVPIPNTWLIDGHSMPEVPSSTYDVVFSIICMQHISCRDWRLEIYSEVFRVLKPGGYFTFQMGYGGGHPVSLDYFHNYTPDDNMHRDVRVENVDDLQKDIENAGFNSVSHVITEPCHDQHPNWIWMSCRKPDV